MRQAELHDYLFLALGQLGGAATKRATLDVIRATVAHQLEDEDYRYVKSGEPRWENDVAFERDAMVKRGLLLNIARDDWRPSPTGWDEYRRVETGALAATKPVSVAASPTPYFKPKDDGEYVARIGKVVLKKSRKHETLVNDFAAWATAEGFTVSNPHPEDLLLQAKSHQWIVEAKVLYLGDARQATRAALAQLLEYRFSLHGNDPDIALIALFSETIGAHFQALLSTLDIATVWQHGRDFKGDLPSP